MILTCAIEDSIIQDLTDKIPIEISIRLVLNEKGFIFDDDDKAGLILNKNPIPLGHFEKHFNAKEMLTFYKQTIKG
ncbi:MAG: hypothetical protein ACC651_17410 [Candidatus Scalindua sp.]